MGRPQQPQNHPTQNDTNAMLVPPHCALNSLPTLNRPDTLNCLLLCASHPYHPPPMPAINRPARPLNLRLRFPIPSQLGQAAPGPAPRPLHPQTPPASTPALAALAALSSAQDTVLRLVSDLNTCPGPPWRPTQAFSGALHETITDVATYAELARRGNCDHARMWTVHACRRYHAAADMLVFLCAASANGECFGYTVSAVAAFVALRRAGHAAAELARAVSAEVTAPVEA